MERHALSPSGGRAQTDDTSPAWLLPSLLIALTGVGLAVEQWLRQAPLVLDESMLALNIRDRSISELAGTLWLGQAAPLGWLIAQRIVIQAVDASELALRTIPLLFGVATVSAAVAIGWRWLGTIGAALLVSLCVSGQWLLYYRAEFKHYSADAFWALALPALAVWTLDQTNADRAVRRRWLAWWTAAAVGQWFANGAVFVTPACALVLWFEIARRHGRHAAVWFTLTGLIWVAAFGLHYTLSLQHAHESAFLRAYWAADVPPASLGPVATAGWVWERLTPLARHPGGASFAGLLWIGATCGWLLHRKRALGLFFMTVPLSAFALAAARIVPLHGRLSLWMVPALYAGLALALDHGIHLIRRARSSRARWQVVSGVVLTALSLAAAGDVGTTAWRNRHRMPSSGANDGLDDRSAARWIRERAGSGDAVMTTRAGWPGLWWYWGVRLEDVRRINHLPDGAVMYELFYEAGGTTCEPSIEDVIRRHPKVLAYVGLLDLPAGFHRRLLEELSMNGRVVATDRFALMSRVAMVVPDSTETELPAVPLPTRAPRIPALVGGCIGVRAPEVW
jgi:hypothetical protein